MTCCIVMLKMLVLVIDSFKTSFPYRNYIAISGPTVKEVESSNYAYSFNLGTLSSIKTNCINILQIKLDIM